MKATSAVAMETHLPGKGPIVYVVRKGRRIVWKRTLSVARGRRDNYRERRRVAWEQEQVCRAVHDTGLVPLEFKNEVAW